MIGFYDILEMGNELEKKMVKHDIKSNNIFSFEVPSEDFKKIDEDIYYRQFPDGKDFEPSENEIQITFKHLTIIIKKEGQN